jgi:hypothetical protein
MSKTALLIPILSGIAALLLIVLVFLGSYNLRQTHSLAQENQKFILCVTHWANATAKRTSILTGLNVKRQDKLDILIRDFALAGSKDPKVKARLRNQFFGHLNTYIGVSNQYKKALKRHPLPKSPKLACANDKR